MFKLVPTKRFTLEPLSEYESWLLDKGARVTSLCGVTLESQYQLGTHSLLLLTDDNYFEARLRIYLLTPKYQVLDEKILGQSFIGNLGLYEHEKLTPPLQIEFSFQGNWRLSIRDNLIDFDQQPAPIIVKQSKVLKQNLKQNILSLQER